MTSIYHITHWTNLARIIGEGGLHCDRNAQTVKSTDIGHQHIKDRRLNRVVPIAPGGTVGDYVPFYFAPRSPMLYAINRGAVANYHGGQAPIIYLCSSVEAVVEKRLEWVFTEGHAEMAYTDFFNDLADLDKIDWKLMREKYWNDTDEDGDRKRRRQAEFLVRNFFPWNLFSYVGVSDHATLEKTAAIIKEAAHQPKLGIQAGWYY